MADIKITGIKDKKTKENFEALVNYMYEDFRGVIGATVKARFYLKAVYGIETPDSIWHDILQAVVERDMRKEKNETV